MNGDRRNDRSRSRIYVLSGRIPEILEEKEDEEEPRTNLRNSEPYTAAYYKYRWIAQSTGRKNEERVWKEEANDRERAILA